MSHPVRFRGNALQLGGVSLEKIASEVATPFYAYDLSDIRGRVLELDSAFQNKADIHYALKANCNRDVLKAVRKAGAGVDTVSAGEIHRALEAGFKPGHVLFSGVGKTESEIAFALQRRIKSLNVESLQELERILRLAKRLKKKPSVMLRLNPNVQAKTHKYISTGGHENKFGFGPEEFRRAIGLLKREARHVRFQGLAFHVGSQMFDMAPVTKAARFLLKQFTELRAEGFALEWADIGGGVGIPYRESEKPADLEKFAGAILKLEWPRDCRLLLEPGRYIAGRSGVLVSEVQYVKQVGKRHFLVLDTGMHHLIRPALYQAYHRIEPLRKRTGSKKVYDVVGPICESSDFLAEGRLLSPVQQGDLVAILDTGAYGFTMASRYNLHRLPEEITVSK